MKKYYCYLLVFVFLISCQEDYNAPSTAEETIPVVNGRLAFADLEQFKETCLLLQQNGIAVEEGRLLNLKYTPYYSTFDKPDAISDDFTVLDLYEFKVLLNASREVQIGEKIYTFTNEAATVSSLTGAVLETIPHETSYYSATTKSFEAPTDGANGKQFGEQASEWIREYEPFGTIGGYYWINYRWLRVSILTLSMYYYDANYLGLPIGSNLEYFKRDISDCLNGDCNRPTNNPYGGYAYNTSHVRYPCGANTTSYENSRTSVYLRARYWIKAYDKFEREVWHQEDIQLP